MNVLVLRKNDRLKKPGGVNDPIARPVGDIFHYTFVTLLCNTQHLICKSDKINYDKEVNKSTFIVNLLSNLEINIFNLFLNLTLPAD